MGAGIFDAVGQTIDPKAAVGIEHDFDDRRIIEEARNRGTKRRPQHTGRTRMGFCGEKRCLDSHLATRPSSGPKGAVENGIS